MNFKHLSIVLLIGTGLFSACKDEAKTPTCSDGIQNQNETNVDCGGPCTPCTEGVHGKWLSSPVAPALANFADSIIAEFKTTGTYQLEYRKSGEIKIYSGEYIQVPSGIDSVFVIQLEQDMPQVTRSSGILQIHSANNRMIYEVVQTTPSIGATPPTIAEGFGSTKYNGVALGTNYVQNYKRIN